MVGVSVALHLQRRGRDVVLVDRRGAGEETSYGNAGLIQRNAGTLKLRPDHKIVYLRNWEDAKTRLAGVAKLAQALAKIAHAAKPEATAQLPQPTPELVKHRSAGRW